MANLRFLVTRTKAQALVETTHETPTNPGEADINSLCLCTDKKCFVWRGNVISYVEPSDIVDIVRFYLNPIIDNSNILKLSTNGETSSFNLQHFKTDRLMNVLVTSLKLGAGIIANNGITLNLGSYLSISSNKLNVNIGTGLTDNIDDQICVCYGVGITEGENHEIIARLGKGLQFDFDGNIVPNLGNGLDFDSDNKIVPKVGTGINLNSNHLYLKLGSGLTLNSDNEIYLNIGTGLEFAGRDVKVKTSDIHGDGLKTDTNGKLTINTLSTSVLYVDDYDKTLAIRTGIGFSVDDYNRLRLTTEVKFDYNSTTGELNIITEQN